MLLDSGSRPAALPGMTGAWFSSFQRRLESRGGRGRSILFLSNRAKNDRKSAISDRAKYTSLAILARRVCGLRRAHASAGRTCAPLLTENFLQSA
jgi:hypothetical protein